MRSARRSLHISIMIATLAPNLLNKTSSIPFCDYIEQNQDALVARLAEAVAIPSVSAEAKLRPEVHRMGKWLEAKLKGFGASVRSVALGPQNIEGTTVELPPVILASYGQDPSKKTICVYGHYDVQPASKEDGWKSDPFVLTEDEVTGVMVGRGTSDDKGPVVGWLNVIEAHQRTSTPMPVNLKMIFEGMEESGSLGLDELIESEAKGFLSGLDAICISDSYWLGTTSPCLTYGLRGIAYFSVSVSGPSRDLHSGSFGGVVHEPMTDLLSLLSKLVTTTGEILIPGITDLVVPLTAAEEGQFDTIDLPPAEFEQAVGGKVLISDEKCEMLKRRMRYPSLSVHGIEGAFSGVGAKTVIPSTVIGKFSLRLVPDLTPDNVNELVQQYLHDEFAKLGTKSTLKVEMTNTGLPWITDITHWNYQAAAKATEMVWGRAPDFTCEGGSIPVTITLDKALGANIVLLPMGRGDDGAHSINEKLDRSNYIEGCKLLGLYLHECAAHK